jgi:hypothetical protein
LSRHTFFSPNESSIELDEVREHAGWKAPDKNGKNLFCNRRHRGPAQTLSDRERRRLLHPLSNVRRWRAATKQNKTKASDDVAKAAAAWRRCVACLEALPPDQAQLLWREVYEQAARASN